MQFVLFHGPEDTWPSHSICMYQIWSEAALFIHRAEGSSVKRTDNTCVVVSYNVTQTFQ